MTGGVQVEAVSGIILLVADLDRAASFYAGALDAEVGVRRPVDDPGALALLGLEGHHVEHRPVRFGEQRIDLLATRPPGRPYPPGSTATDLWFQHCALVVGDMDRAYARVAAAGAVSITRRGPQRLPASAGGVRAYKFRDPDGHPLELLAFPPGTAARWEGGGAALVRGIDHTAIAVSDASASTRFYEARLGLRRKAATLNHGPAQVALDDVVADRVDVVALAPARDTPHVELLGYHVGSRRPVPDGVGPADIALTRLVLRARDPAPLAGSGECVRFGAGGRGVALNDPDGHHIIVTSAGLLD